MPRRRVIACALFLLLITVGCVRPTPAAVSPAAPPPAPAPAPAPAPPAPPRIELPGGGTTIFPAHRVVAFYGTAGTDALGVLGEGTPDQAADRLAQAAAPFATPDRTVLPAMELIVTVANETPGAQGDYSTDIDLAEARAYLDAARRHGQLLILDVQPGTADFLTASRVWEPLLREPDVSLALDPEWRMAPGEVPGQVIGGVSAAEVNETAAWLADIVRVGNLPQKLLVLHQFTPDMITSPEQLATPPELAVVQHIDGFGAPETKREKYAQLQRAGQLHLGFKLFYDEDTPMLSPAEALALQPVPELITYQ